MSASDSGIKIKKAVLMRLHNEKFGPIHFIQMALLWVINVEFVEFSPLTDYFRVSIKVTKVFKILLQCFTKIQNLTNTVKRY